MKTQKSDPDPFEGEIICELALVRVKRGEWKTGLWTREVKNAVGRVAEKRGYSICAEVPTLNERGSLPVCLLELGEAVFRLLSSYCHWVDHFPQAKK